METETIVSTKVLVSSHVMSKMLKLLLPVVSANPLLPILENVLIELKGDILTLTASDLRTGLSIDVYCEPITASTVPVYCVNAKLLAYSLEGLPEQPLTLTFGEKLIVDGDQFKFTLAITDSPLDFPKLPAIPDAGSESVQINNAFFRQALIDAQPYICNDDLRPAMSGVCIESDGKKLSAVATDGHKMVMVDFPCTDKLTECIIPKSTVATMIRMLNDRQATLFISGTRGLLKGDSFRVQFRLIEERFVDYKPMMQEVKSTKFMTIARDTLASSIKYLLRLSNPTTHQLIVNLTPNRAEFSVLNLDWDLSASKRIEVEYENEPFDIAFNGKFLLLAIKNIRTPLVRFEMSANNRAVLLKPVVSKKQDYNYLHLIMPVMLNQYS